jgi:hypothetical protein
MPKSLVIGTIAGLVVLIALMSWLNNRSLQPDETANTTVAPVETPAPAQPKPQPAAPAVAGQSVVLTATAPVWFQVSEKGGATLFSGTLQPGQTYAVPASAVAPVLKTGKPEGLQVKVGNQAAPPVGPAATTVSNVSLLAADLMKGAAPAEAAPVQTTVAPKRVKASATPPAAAPALETPATETAATTNIGE